MSKIDAEERVGIFLKKNDFQLAEIEKSASSQFRINRLIQARIETKFDLISLQKENQIIEIANQIVEIIRAYKADAKNVVFAIESPLAMVKKFPLDANLTAE